MTKKTTLKIVQRAQTSLGELELNVHTKADKRRIAQVARGLRALDDEQADTKAAIYQAILDYQEGILTGESTNSAAVRLIATLRALAKVPTSTLARMKASFT
ncbi:MAG: hypothetical protein ACHREM_08950 [Polyangiales bacterium]